MKKKKLIYLALLVVNLFPSLLYGDSSIEETGDIRIGIFSLEPINFIDENGKASGLYPDLIREIFKDEKRSVSFVEGSWAQGLERLQSGEIDLMISVAYTEERDEIMDYNLESVVELWGQVFIRPENKSININQLQNRKVGIMAKDINGNNFIDTASDFGIHCEIIEYESHSDVFQAVQDGAVFAGVAPQHFGLRNAGIYDLIPSTIQFSPFSIFFAAKEGHHTQLLRQIDSHLIRWKEKKNSFYYKTLAYWMTDSELRKTIVPQWLILSLSAMTVIALLFFLFMILLRIQVKRKTGELLKRERQYQGLVENAENIIIRINKRGRVFFVNKYGLELFGFKKEEILGRDPIGKIFSPENDMMNWINKLNVSFVDVVTTGDKRTIYNQWNNKVISDEDGIIEEVLCIGTDISKRLGIEKELKETNLQLEEMVYIASHDLQVPLVSMEGYASELLENYSRKLDEEGVYCLTRLQLNARRMHRLVLSLLDISRLNTIQNFNSDFSMNDLICKIENDISLLMDKEEGSLFASDLPDLYADKSRIEGVFRNLIVNAFNYGGKKVEILFSDGVFSIIDDGIGIPESQLEKVFKPGERLKMNKAEGVGMGLTFCKKVIEQHNGSIWIESEGKGKGCIFFIKLPADYLREGGR